MADNQTQMKEIEQLLEEYKKGMTPEQSRELVEKMKEVRFIVPVTFPQDETLAAMLAELDGKDYLTVLKEDPVLAENFKVQELEEIIKPENYTGLSAFLARRMAKEAKEQIQYYRSKPEEMCKYDIN